jgi:hypothetical protein
VIRLIALLGIPIEHHGPFRRVLRSYSILDSREPEKNLQIVSFHRLQTFEILRALWKARPLERSTDAGF